MKIKFRAYNTITEKMTNWQDIEDCRNLQKLMGLNHVVVTQWTGLNDKNGKEIYAGDLIRTPDNRILHIVFKEGCFGFENRFENSFEIKKFAYFTKALVSIIEVVGNIYDMEKIPMFRGTKKELENLF